MKNDTVTPNQAVYSIVLFNFGSSVVMGFNGGLCQDTTISITIATLMAVPVFLLYARLFALFPNKNLYEMADQLFGRVIGRIVAVLFTWYCIHLAALILRDFSEFTQVSTMPETPQLPIMIMMVLTSIYMARSGIKSIGKWSIGAFFIVCFVVVMTFSVSLRQIRLGDMLPLLELPPAEIAEFSVSIFAFPYAETVIFLGLGGALSTDKPHRILMRALVLVYIIFMLVFVRNIVLLGQKMMGISYFPSYITARIIEIGDFLARMEGLISSNFLLAGLLKISICLLAAANGLTYLLRLEDYRAMALPCGIFAMALCATLYKSTMSMFAFLDYYAYYAFPFQVIIPLALLIVAEIQHRRQHALPRPQPGKQ